MKRNTPIFYLFSFLLAIFVLTGCATTRPKPADPSDPSAQVAELRNELQTKDQQIQDLQVQLTSYEESIKAEPAGAGGKSVLIRVQGVSVKDLQAALARTGYDPGSVDGRMGKKTKSAIKAFQKKNGLKADGVVGEKTWALLKK